MSLVAGTVAVNSSGVASGGGMARAIYDALLGTAGMVTLLAMQDTDQTQSNYVPPTAKVTAKQGMAEMATAIGDAVVGYLTANASLSGNAHVTTQSLGALPTTITAGQPIAGPSTPVDVPLAGGIQ